LNFHVQEGEIVGFLGPNGAGKSTTMRILSSFLPPTSGRAEVAGYDVFEQSLEARRNIGYMPEDVPLYADMRVKEYLRYRGALKGLSGKKLRRRLDVVSETCGLTEVHRKMIGALSKGYRQRVGLADALIHQPRLLILDEPTIGLDPNQIRQVRSLISDLGRKHTILLSTHILSEVEMTCSRVLIINRGRIQASDTPRNLLRRIRRAGGISLEIHAGGDDPVRELEHFDGVREVTLKDSTDEGWKTLHLRIEAETDPREQLYNFIRKKNWRLRELSAVRATLEDVFVEITQSEDM
jgi:ABC-2 type transport system ATP-binding protein